VPSHQNNGLFPPFFHLKLKSDKMKKTFILTFALVLAFVVSHAQTEKGTQTIGVNLQYLHLDQSGSIIYPFSNSSTDVGFKSTSLAVGPAYSYFVANNLDLGVSVSYQNYQSSYPDDSNSLTSKSTNESIGGSIYLRKYFMYKNIIGLRVGPMFSYNHGTGSTIYFPVNAAYDQHSKFDNYNFGLRAELVYYPTKHIGLSAMLANVGYSYQDTKDNNQGSQTSKSTYLNFINDGLSLSVFYSFGGK
jgi:hypothetical protein